MSASRKLDGKRVLVTGGASGLGRAIAERFSGEGARIAVCDVNDAALEDVRLHHPSWLCLSADVAIEGAVGAMYDEIRRNFDGLEVLVNNAGISGPTAPIEEIEAEAWQAVFDVNVLSAFFCIRLAIPMLRVQGGTIINMSSAAGRFGYPFRAPYASAKWALVGLTHSLASELGPAGIRVNAILPGMTNGPRLDAAIHVRAAKFGRTDEEQMALQLQSTSLRASVEAQDIANAALYLASDDGRRITGVALPVDAGLETISWR